MYDLLAEFDLRFTKLRLSVLFWMRVIYPWFVLPDHWAPSLPTIYLQLNFRYMYMCEFEGCAGLGKCVFKCMHTHEARKRDCACEDDVCHIHVRDVGVGVSAHFYGTEITCLISARCRMCVHRCI